MPAPNLRRPPEPSLTPFPLPALPCPAPSLPLRPRAQEGFWSWLSGVTDNSIYPVMLAANLKIFVPILGVDGWVKT